MGLDWESKQTEEEWEKDIEELDELLEQEEQMWNAQGFHLGMIQLNAYHINAKLNVVIDFMEQELGMSQTELNARFKGAMLNSLKHDRGMLIEERLKSKRPDLAIPKTQILGPGGLPL